MPFPLWFSSPIRLSEESTTSTCKVLPPHPHQLKSYPSLKVHLNAIASKNCTPVLQCRINLSPLGVPILRLYFDILLYNALHYNYLRSLLPPPSPNKIPSAVRRGRKEMNVCYTSVPSEVLSILHTLSHLICLKTTWRGKVGGGIPILLIENVLFRVQQLIQHHTASQFQCLWNRRFPWLQRALFTTLCCSCSLGVPHPAWQIVGIP